MSVGVLKRFLLWDFPRGGWQYDVIVALILAFIFLTPRDVFRDQPKASNIVMLPNEGSASVFWLEADLLAGVPEAARARRATELVKQKAKAKREIDRVVPIFDAEDDIKGYMAYSK